MSFELTGMIIDSLRYLTYITRESCTTVERGGSPSSRESSFWTVDVVSHAFVLSGLKIPFGELSLIDTHSSHRDDN